MALGWVCEGREIFDQDEQGNVADHEVRLEDLDLEFQASNPFLIPNTPQLIFFLLVMFMVVPDVDHLGLLENPKDLKNIINV